jgi:uncharacterized membrane protein
MDFYFLIKTVHIISATILFGTGAGIAFFMLCSRFTGNLQEKFYAARVTVLADYLFTLPAVILQPLTGAWLVWKAGYDWTAPWLVWTYILYTIAGLCWLPVVWMQLRMKNILQICVASNTVPPPEYDRLFRIWFVLGWPAFASLVIVFFLMVVKSV